MKSLRQLHLYLGVFFAPLIAFFAFTGILQTYDLHETLKKRCELGPDGIDGLGYIYR